MVSQDRKRCNQSAPWRTIYNDLAGKRPDMPQEAQNLFEKRASSVANEHHIKTVSVVAGKLVVEPIDIPRDKMVPVRRAGGRYLSDKRKLQLPLKYFRLTEKDNLFGPVAKFLREMHGEE